MSKKSQSSHVIPVLAGLAAMALVGATVWALDWAEGRRYRTEIESKVLNRLGLIRGEVQAQLNRRLHLVAALKAGVSDKPKITEDEFNALARTVHKAATGIRSVSLIEKTKIKYVYPLKGNKDARGFDIAKSAEQRAALNEAIRLKKPTLDGPIHLTQGGQAFVYRVPVFAISDHGNIKAGQFWGLVSILIHRQMVEDLFRPAASDELEIRVAARRTDADGGAVFAGDPEILSADPLEMNIMLPGGRWVLHGLPKDGWPQSAPISSILRACGACLAVLMGFLVFRLFETNRQLGAAMESAEQASRAKGTFLANMSHEIRTPLNAILGMTELALGTKLDSTQREYLRSVDDSGRNLSILINDVLDLSKAEAGEVRLDAVAFDVDECVATTMKALAVRANEKKLSLTSIVDPRLPIMRVGDRERVRQVLTNFIANAIKFTHEGGIVVRVEQHNTVDSVHVSVRDTGIGIPADKLESVFDAFEQVDVSTTREYGGTGLGLSISRQLIEAMGGRVWAESEVGSGSTFHFVADLPPTGDQPAYPEIEGKRVAVVANDRVTRDHLVELLSQRAATPVDAIDQADVVLIDGEKSKELHGISSRAIVMTSLSGLSSVADAGFSKVLVKPIHRAELFQAITEALAGPQRTVEPPLQPLSDDTSLRVLLADDSVINQKLACAQLKKIGHVVTVVGTGREAVEAVDRAPFDIILMDVEMPEMDGLEATQAIRKREQNGGIAIQDKDRLPILAMTARAMSGDREQCLAAGMDGYLSKPVRLDELAEAIAKVV